MRRRALDQAYPDVMTAAYDHFPDLHDLVEQLNPEQAAEVRSHLLRLVQPEGAGLCVLGIFDGPDDGLASHDEEALRTEARRR
jgi:hypothetical protein